VTLVVADEQLVGARPLPLLRWISWAAAAWGFLAPLSQVQVSSVGPVSAVPLFLAALLAVIHTASESREGRPTLPANMLVITLFALLITGVASSINTGDVAASVSQYARGALAILAAVIVIGTLARYPAYLDRVMYAFCIGGVALAVSMPVTHHADAGRLVGLAGNPVEVGGSAAAAVTYLLLRSAGSLWRRLLDIVLAIIAAFAFLGAQTLTGPIAAIAALLIAIAARRVLRPSLVLLLGAVGFGAFYAVSVSPVGAQLLQKWQQATSKVALNNLFDPQVSTLAGRMYTIRAGLDKVGLHPLLGSGFAPSDSIVYGDLQPHDVLVLAWLSGGIVFFGLFAWYFIRTVVYLWRLGRFVRERRPGAQYLALGGASVAAWISALTGPQLYQSAWLLPMLVVVILSFRGHESHTNAAA
jgi:O-antigen ligase